MTPPHCSQRSFSLPEEVSRRLPQSLQKTREPTVDIAVFWYAAGGGRWVLD